MSVTNQSWLDAQYSVLGSALIEPKVVPRIMAETSEADFSGACLTVYQAMQAVFLSGFPGDLNLIIYGSPFFIFSAAISIGIFLHFVHFPK